MNIFKLCAAILQDFGHPKNRCWHTQLNVCEKERFTAVEEVLIIKKKIAKFFGPRMFIRS